MQAIEYYPELEGLCMVAELLELFSIQQQTFQEKQQDYAKPDDCFENFRTAGQRSRQSPECALYGMVLKHVIAWDRAYSILIAREKLYPPDFYLDKLGDILVYADFWRCMAHARLEHSAFGCNDLPKVNRSDQANSAAGLYMTISESIAQEWGVSRDFLSTIKSQHIELSDAFDKCRFHIFQNNPSKVDYSQLIIEAERCQKSAAILYAAMILICNANNRGGYAYR